jgi:hypothetical protein
MLLTYNKLYKSSFIDFIRMFPSDPKGSLDDFMFLNMFKTIKFGDVLWKKH